ncbi:MAG: alkaline phosphatase family protein [Paludibacteraceae bacterium]|nr:alkaline phosphatase family protein [Paludibacteraceae bacterium]MBQ1752689.1 alkaline phosphatase family protein [Paludibacteraceae bacterium]MBQ1851319.1 alkaline phosphatase family protein [Paludibacteraceae bacterium]MBQ2065818.1 alkaline phosphatase family protein [Paludibacteraceae bacterium]MBQ4033182.1 alkaline phosphatase family protein [Paludibacteraceae bacterium]
MLKRIITLSIAFISAVAAIAGKPKLVVIITVQNLNTFNIGQFYDEFQEGGFKRMAGGTYYPRVEFSYLATDHATDVATLLTGTEPCLHGIIGEKRFYTKELKYIYTLTDDKSHGLNDDRHLSGRALNTLTYADILNEETYGVSKIVSVATNPTIAMLMAGHSGLPIYMNNLNGEWSTSSYYTEQMPKWLEQYNSEKPIEGYMERTWENLYPAAYYKAAAAVGGTGFSYGVKATCNGLKMYDNFTTIPYCNDYICDLALKAAEKEKMGNDLTTDLLMVNFSLSRFFMKDGVSVSIEEEDAYLRLDKTLKRLIETLENKVGKENIVVALIGSRTGAVNTTTTTNRRIEYSPFNIDKYSALLNSYLMAFYGQKKWVLGCRGGNIYLNREEIEKTGLNLKEVSEKAKEFFYLIPGVQNLCTAEQMEEAFYSNSSMHYAYYRNLSGDLLYSLMPRWYEVDIDDKPTGYFTSYNTDIPLYIYGGGHNKETKGSIKATELLRGEFH